MRVVIAEDLFLVREGMARLLSADGIDVVAAVDDGEALLAAITEHRPDLAMVDVRMPPTFTDEGLLAALEARRRWPGLPVLVVSHHVEPVYARELLAAPDGGVGYLLKDRVFDVDGFVDAVRRVAGGGVVMDPEVVSQLLTGTAVSDRLVALSAVERSTLALMAEGRTNAAIAARLETSEKSVSRYCTAIFTKLGLASTGDDNRRVLAVLAYLDR